MKLNLTKKQYKYLVEMCLIGAYVIEESKVEVEENYNEILRYILSFGEKTCVKIPDYMLEGLSEVAATVMDNVNFEEDFLSNYNERNFWKELARRIASRDALEELGYDVTQANFASYITLKDKYEKKYIEKFDIDNYNNRELPY